ncbi:carboxylesterase [Pseudomonas sp. LB-090624]|uniref:carboxylesterase/lipase family protein n=1 Tax=Pseudomonas sp. LB-090624 TaxID=2213079 RepID=UPI000D836814|nr:carboxylesterase family protein [Pseudomonas sp. LB-090624]PYB78952.1 carboxylesterase [Pseudomonas sp. LB-090624]
MRKNALGGMAGLVVLTLVASRLSLAAPVVSTSEGMLSGLSAGGVVSFLGIPYAAPPVGSLRWRAPEPVSSWTGTRKAQAFQSSCYQPEAPEFGPYSREFLATPPPSEDCLYLNVWAPEDRSKRYPVMVWLHGGGFIGGSGAVPIYNGSQLAKQGVVVVTVNYRLGPFGFLTHPALAAENTDKLSGNYGLLDQIAALKWVRANISQFGGDAKNITLTGQSAGAISTAYLTSSPLAQGLFAKAILQSPVTLGGQIPDTASAERDGLSFGKYFGITTARELRQLPAKEIAQAIWLPFVSSNLPKIQFQPHLDGWAITENFLSYHSKHLLKIPLIIGFTADEALTQLPQNKSDFVKWVKGRFGDFAERLLALYPHDADAQAASSAKALDRDCYMVSLSFWAQQVTQHTDHPVYTYLFTHVPPAAAGRSFGAFHTAEVPYLFNVLDRTSRPYEAADSKMASVIQGYWAAFMSRTGIDSAGGGDASWTPANARPDNVMRLDINPHMDHAASTVQRQEVLRAYFERAEGLTN